MSSAEVAAEIITVMQSQILFEYLDLGVLTVAIYDWMQTLPDEIRLIWRRKITGATALFLINRYSFILIFGLGLAYDFMPQNNGAVGRTVFVNTGYENRKSYLQSCSGVAISRDVVAFVHDFNVNAFQVLRVYAVTGGAWQVALLVGMVMVFPLAFSILMDAASTYLTVFYISQGCVASTSYSEAVYNRCNVPILIDNISYLTTLIAVVISERVCLITADAIVVAVTIYKLYGTVKAAREANIKSSLSSMLLQSGIVYFCVMLVMNVSDFIVTLTTSIDYAGGPVALVESLLISHFLLNLQDVNSALVNGSDPSRPSFVQTLPERSHISTIRFATIVLGNIGAPLRHGTLEEDDEDEIIELDEGALAAYSSSDVGAQFPQK